MEYDGAVIVLSLMPVRVLAMEYDGAVIVLSLMPVRVLAMEYDGAVIVLSLMPLRRFRPGRGRAEEGEELNRRPNSRYQAGPHSVISNARTTAVVTISANEDDPDEDDNFELYESTGASGSREDSRL
uniref:Movement protein n=1 Tax=Macrostomum lignano TaxID=282301 RepID=A0A1I8JD15_9PLAT